MSRLLAQAQHFSANFGSIRGGNDHAPWARNCQSDVHGPARCAVVGSPLHSVALSSQRKISCISNAPDAQGFRSCRRAEGADSGLPDEFGPDRLSAQASHARFEGYTVEVWLRCAVSVGNRQGVGEGKAMLLEGAVGRRLGLIRSRESFRKPLPCPLSGRRRRFR